MTQRRRAAAPAAASQRDRLRSRPRPSLPYPLLVDPDRAAAARAELEEAQRHARQAGLAKDPQPAVVEAARARVAAAEAALEDCYETIVLRALPPDDLEQLRAEHPPTAEQIAAAKAERKTAVERGEKTLPPWPDVNQASYVPALLAACAADSGMSMDDWVAFLAENVSAAERIGLWQAAEAVNSRERVADPLVLPKGSTPMLS